ncbi:MAG: hypothetical protein ACREQ2_28875 [Candidatus Binatia bacterium]
MARVNYTTALRCIGQDLDRRGLKSFDIRLKGIEYIVECGYQEPPSPTPVSIKYTFKDIGELDRIGENRRGGTPSAAEFLNQAQIFRTIGGYLDKSESLLVRMTNNDGTSKDSLIKVEYLTRDGEHVMDDRAGSAIYDMCVQMYKQRGRMTGTGGRRFYRRG